MIYGPVEYVVGLFKDENAASVLLKKIQDEKLEAELGLREMAVIQKDATGNLHIHEPSDAGGGKGAAVGGVVGALVGVLLGPAVVATTAAGALVGGLASKLHDTGFDNKDLKALAESLTPGSSALMLVVDDVQFGRVRQMLEEQKATVIANALNPEVAEDLNNEYAAFIDKLKERGVDGLTAKDWSLVSGDVDDARRDMQFDRGTGYSGPVL